MDTDDIHAIEGRLSRKKDELMKFEKEYLAAKVAFEKAVLRHQHENEEVKALIAAREAAYCALTLPSVVKESEEPAMGGFTMPTIDANAFKNFSFANPFAK